MRFGFPARHLPPDRLRDFERWLETTTHSEKNEWEVARRLDTFDDAVRVEALLRLLQTLRRRRLTDLALAAAWFLVAAGLNTVVGAPWVLAMLAISAGVWVARSRGSERQLWHRLTVVATSVEACRNAPLSGLLRLEEALRAPSLNGRPTDPSGLATAAVRRVLADRLAAATVEELWDVRASGQLGRSLLGAVADYRGSVRHEAAPELNRLLIAELLAAGEVGAQDAVPVARQVEQLAVSSRLKEAAQECLRLLSP